MLKKLSCPILALIFGCLFVYGYSVHADLSDELLRLHIIANSDSEYDQELKIKVRNEIINMSQNDFAGVTDKKECRKTILASKEKIKDAADKILAENGADYTARVSFEKLYIPRKTYDGIILPEGSYDGVVIRLGNAEGKNWWCVVYPPLCFTESVCGELSDEAKEYLKSTLSEESYSLITCEGMNIEYKFKIVEILQQLNQKGVHLPKK